MAQDEAFRDTIISVDTFRAEVAWQAVAAGATVVNDVSGGLLDPDMLPEVSIAQSNGRRTRSVLGMLAHTRSALVISPALGRWS